MAIDSTGRLALDARALDRLRADARTDPQAALRGAAQQFEAIFMNMLLKSMRESLPQDGPFSSDATRMYTGMLDEQLAQHVAAKGLGLADVLVRQLTRHLPVRPEGDATSTGAPPVGGAPGGALPNGAVPASAPAAAPVPAGSPPADAGGRAAFIDRLLPHARAVASATGIPARFILGQAAHESGWGSKEIRGADGAPSFNLFGIKASAGWTGKTAEVFTTEYVNGVAQKVVQTFRAYGSYAEAFADWAKLVTGSARYAEAIAAGGDAAGFARGLQSGGYATDPAYAEKLTRAINHALLQRV